MVAAARRPEATLSLALLGAAASRWRRAQSPAAQASSTRSAECGTEDLPDEQSVVRFLTAVGSDPDQLGPELLATAVATCIVPRDRPFFDRGLPLDAADDGEHSRASSEQQPPHRLSTPCAPSRGGSRSATNQAVIAGAGHEIQSGPVDPSERRTLLRPLAPRRSAPSLSRLNKKQPSSSSPQSPHRDQRTGSGLGSAFVPILRSLERPRDGDDAAATTDPRARSHPVEGGRHTRPPHATRHTTHDPTAAVAPAP